MKANHAVALMHIFSLQHLHLQLDQEMQTVAFLPV